MFVAGLLMVSDWGCC